MPSTRLRVLAGALLLAAAFAGCGDDDDDSGVGSPEAKVDVTAVDY